MPPLPPVLRVVKIKVTGNIGSKPWVNIFHARYTSPGTPDNTDLTAIAQTVHTAYSTNLINVTRRSSDVSIEETFTQDLTSSTSATGAYSAHAVGTFSGESAGAAVCVLWKHTIANRYRGGHPRTYAPSFGSNIIATANSWGGAQVAQEQTAVNTLVTAINAFTSTNITTLTFGCVHYYSAHALLTPPTFDDIIASTVENVMATQRRRVGR